MRSPIHDLEFAAAAQALSTLDHLGVAELEVLHRLELTASVLYEAIADRLDAEAVADVLRRNAREELGHARRMRRALSILAGGGYDVPEYLERTYAVTVPGHVSPVMLTAMVDGERGGHADYQRWAASEPDPAVARLLEVSGQEELHHADRLAAALHLP